MRFLYLRYSHASLKALYVRSLGESCNNNGIKGIGYKKPSAPANTTEIKTQNSITYKNQ